MCTIRRGKDALKRDEGDREEEEEEEIKII